MERYEYYTSMTVDDLHDELRDMQAELQLCRHCEPDAEFGELQAEIHEVREAMLMHQVDRAFSASDDAAQQAVSKSVWTPPKPTLLQSGFSKIAKRLAGSRLFPHLRSRADAHEDYDLFGREGKLRMGDRAYHLGLSITQGVCNVMDSQHVSLQFVVGCSFRPIFSVMYVVCAGDEPVHITGLQVEVAFGRLQYSYPPRYSVALQYQEGELPF